MAKKPVPKKVTKAAKPRSPLAPRPVPAQDVQTSDLTPAKKPVLYVKAGVTVGWRDHWVFDLKTKRYVRDVAEANVPEGWYNQAVRNVDGTLQRRGDGIAYRRVRAPIRIDRRTDR